MLEELGKVFSFNKIRGLKFLEMLQYITILVILSVYWSYFINKIYIYMKGIEYKGVVENTDGLMISIFKLIIEVYVLVISYFYIRKVAKVIPSAANYIYPKFRPGTTLEYVFDFGLIMVLIELQPETKSRIEHISHLMLGNVGGHSD